jgi:hypothetical protein
MMRPPDVTSSIATSSATRRGWTYRGSALPMMPTGMRLVFAMMCAALRFGLGMFP